MIFAVLLSASAEPECKDRIFTVSDHLQPNAPEEAPIKVIISKSDEAAVVTWTVAPGQRLPSHTHPRGQDTWTVLSGRGEYVVDAENSTRPIMAGDVVIAKVGEVHGVYNPGEEPLVFVSTVTPADGGFEKLEWS